MRKETVDRRVHSYNDERTKDYKETASTLYSEAAKGIEELNDEYLRHLLEVRAYKRRGDLSDYMKAKFAADMIYHLERMSYLKASVKYLADLIMATDLHESLIKADEYKDMTEQGRLEDASNFYSQQ